MLQDTTGSGNAAYGFQALMNNTTESGNIAIGYNATNSVSVRNALIRIGTVGTQTSAYMAGVFISRTRAGAGPVEGRPSEPLTAINDQLPCTRPSGHYPNSTFQMNCLRGSSAISGV
jgi:hypothetical protein